MDVEIVLPEVAHDRISVDLRDLTEEIAKKDSELLASGLLGGEFGYGCEYENPVFEMHPYWWGDCECGHEDAAWQWEEDNPHKQDCYQVYYRDIRDDKSLKFMTPEYDAAVSELCSRFGFDPKWGSAVHCSCGQQEAWEKWIKVHKHDPRCRVVLPNFIHKATGFSVEWYKYIGRGMEFSQKIDKKQWRAIFNECLESVNPF